MGARKQPVAKHLGCSRARGVHAVVARLSTHLLRCPALCNALAPMQLERVHQDVFSSITGCSTRVADLQCSVPSTQVAGAGELLLVTCETARV